MIQHPTLQRIQAELQAKRSLKPRSAARKALNLEHDQLTRFALYDGINKLHERYDFIIAICPECKRGYIVERILHSDVPEELKTISYEQYEGLVKGWATECDPKVDKANKENDQRIKEALDKHREEQDAWRNVFTQSEIWEQRGW